MVQEGESVSDVNQEMRQILSEFLADVVKLEGLAEAGKRFLISFQQALEVLRRPSVHKTSDLIQSILKANETKRVKSYVEAGCVNAYDRAQSVSQMNTSLSGLQDHLVKAKSILSDLEALMDNAGVSLQCLPGSLTPFEKPSELYFVENSVEESISEWIEITSEKAVSADAVGCASSMAVIYGMVKQDYLMQERVVSSLGLKSSSGELESYCLMWSLRPFVDDDIIHEAMTNVR